MRLDEVAGHKTGRSAEAEVQGAIGCNRGLFRSAVLLIGEAKIRFEFSGVVIYSEPGMIKILISRERRPCDNKRDEHEKQRRDEEIPSAWRRSL